MKRLAKLLKKEDGSVAIEYALITSLIALAIVATVAVVGVGLLVYLKKRKR